MAATTPGENLEVSEQVSAFAEETDSLPEPTHPRLRRITVFTQPQPPAARRASATSTPDLVLELSAGVRAPVAFAASDDALSPAQASALQEISDQFVARINDAAATLADEDLAQVWTAEQEQADSIYRIVFGDSAYLQKSMETAINALDQPSSPEDASETAQ